MKKILLLSTGGTIASEGFRGLSPRADTAHELQQILIEDYQGTVDHLPLMNIDSSNMTPPLMGEIATAIYQDLDNYDAFIVTHGTDTLSYTAAALV